jgi:hypothetical protein
MRPPQLHKVGVVSLLDKDIFPIVAAIVDVKESSKGDGWYVAWHDLFLEFYTQLQT